ncbi:MAG: OmpA family protein [Alphaproteobacteria bacterium]|nr:OmpA family protein [Alphaproteobacteria bacterium]
MKFSRILPAVAGLFLLSACGYNSLEIQGIRAASPAGGTPFTQALVTEYKALVEEEIKVEYEWLHASVIAKKGLQANAGQVVLPWGQETYPSPAPQVAEMNSERARLIRVLDAGARGSKPAVAARAQVMYDCWLEEVWEGQDDGVCKAAYMKAMAELEAKPAAAAAPSRSFMVFFDLNKADITAAAAKTISEAAMEAKKTGRASINLVGHADNSGPKGSAYNLALSQRRVDAVRAALIAQGIDTRIISSHAKGDDALLVKTPPNTREPQNRRVEIVLP